VREEQLGPALALQPDLATVVAGLAGESSGAIVVDIAAEPISTDPRLWSPDRLHAGPLGHERIAAALAEALALEGNRHRRAHPGPALLHAVGRAPAPRALVPATGASPSAPRSVPSTRDGARQALSSD
jgi:hypothetical protein